ncbi:MAG: helix-turn-helix transcriptional regulator [Oscillospiraceae bacterium]|nr:helix-turn-helix transcriptional regulator [Oscillospiraceae bacterium]
MRKKLKAARWAADLTQQQMADKLGLSLIGYRQIECGKRIGKIETWDKLEDLFNIHQRILRENLPE